VEIPMFESKGIEEWEQVPEEQEDPIITKYFLAPTNGCFGIATRDVEFSAATVSWSNITVRKKSMYRSLCTYQQPQIQGCKALPFRKGDFAYTESEEVYPDNKELFD